MNDRTNNHGEQSSGVSRRAFIGMTAAGVTVIGLSSMTQAAAPRAYGAGAQGSSADLTITPVAYGAVYVGRTAQFVVKSPAPVVNWTVTDIWNDVVRSGSARMNPGGATVSVPVDDGYYVIEATASGGTASARLPFTALAPYRLPADSAFGANTHLQPATIVPLLAALGITWARTDLQWELIEPAPLAGWTTQVYQADATVSLDTGVAHTGTSSVKITNASAIQDNYYATIAQPITVAPSTTYTISAWVKGEGVNSLAFTVASDWGNRVDAPSGTYDWTEVTFEHTTGAGETSFNLRLLSSDITTAAWMDDVVVVAQGSSANLVTNPGFELGLVSGYTFDTFDPYVHALLARGINPLPILDYANPKYDDGNTPYTDPGRAAFAAYATAVMEHYGPRIHATEVYNEWNAGWFNTGPAGSDPVVYAQLLAATYDAVKAVNPHTKVVGGVTYGTATDWLGQMFAAGGMTHLDVISNHPYTGNPESNGGIDAAEAQVVALIKNDNGGVAKPVWVSELGWSLGDELTTAGFLVRGLVLSLAGGVEKFFWYDLIGDQNYGLLNQTATSLTPRPAFSAYANAIRLIDGHDYAGGGQVGSGTVRRYGFTSNSRAQDVVVLWSTGTHDAVTVATNSPLTLVDVTGTPTTVVPLNGQLHLTATGTPIFLLGRGIASHLPVVATDLRIDVTAPQLIRTADGDLQLSYALDNTHAAAADLTFTTLGISTRVRAAAGKAATVVASLPVSLLSAGSNTLVTFVRSGGTVVGRLSTTVVVIDEPAGAIATIGAVDWTDDGFALAPGGYGSYSTNFPNDVTFTVGSSDPAQAWPYIHPGPDDGWAGSRAHPFTVSFHLDAVPSAGLQLVVFLLDTHNTDPGSVSIALNSGAPTSVALPAGGGSGYADGSALTSGDQPYQFAVDLPAAILATGANTIVITKTSGSWMVYDAIGIFAA
ncbi:MAG: hypothetical protein JWP75_687 [Frondihabitans sp.]|nr:hypothetical protein [Frondihabitans sp.]